MASAPVVPFGFSFLIPVLGKLIILSSGELFGYFYQLNVFSLLMFHACISLSLSPLPCPPADPLLNSCSLLLVVFSRAEGAIGVDVSDRVFAKTPHHTSELWYASSAYYGLQGEEEEKPSQGGHC